MEWKPIETAPKDCSEVLLYVRNQYGRGVRCVARWYGKFQLEVGEDHYGDWGDWHEPSGQYYCHEGWYEETFYSDDGIIAAVHDDPTHWMPLPEPPAVE